MGFISSKHLYKGVVNTAQLDALMTSILTSKGYVEYIVAAVKMVLYVSYILARKALIDQQLEIEKQEYEQKQTNNNGQGMDDNPIIKPKPTSDLDG